MKKNDYMIDISAYQSADARIYGYDNVIVKATESLSYINPKYYSQKQTASHFVGAYHFARFGGNTALAAQEARFFLSHAALSKNQYAILDYEDNYADPASNTEAILVFMRTVKNAGLKPILYTGANAAITHMNMSRITAEFPRSLWVASYAVTSINSSIGSADYTVLARNLGSQYSAIMPHIRWFQFSSTAIPVGLDLNVVLIDDEDTSTSVPKILKEVKNQYMLIFTLTETGQLGDHKFGKGAKFLFNQFKGTCRYLSQGDWNEFYKYFEQLPQFSGDRAHFTALTQILQCGNVVKK